MKIRTIGMSLMIIVACSGLMCLGDLQPPPDDVIVQVRLVNDSSTLYVAPNLGICPNGMSTPPHFFVETPPVLGPGEETTITTWELGGLRGRCRNCSENFMIGLCGWSYGDSAEKMATVQVKFGGQIDVQFSCGDTVILTWSDTGGDAGTWTSAVEPGPGNDPPAAPFQEL